MLKLPRDIFSVWWMLVFCVLFSFFFMGGGGGGLIPGLRLYPSNGALFNLGAMATKSGIASGCDITVVNIVNSKIPLNWLLVLRMKYEDTHSLYNLLIRT